MNKILVPLDGSELSDGILKHVEPLIAAEPCEVVLLRVLPPPAPDDIPGRAQAERDVAAAHLTTTGARLEALGAKVTTTLRQGDPALEILTATDALRPALVAMSSHGRTGVLRWIRGSVAERVLRTCATPLLLVTPRAVGREGEARLRRILVPLDGSERSAAVLPLVEELARRHSAEVLLLRVEWEGLSRPVLANLLTPGKVAESLHPWVERLKARGIPVRALAAQGDFASEILDTADREDVDLLAMTTHGRTGLPRLVDGSVSEQVLRHCRRPLLVVRAGE
jgi:nucleotide-binding universal stress UspA family protein